MKYLVSYYYKNDMEKRYKRYDSMQMAIAFANMLIAQGDYVIDKIEHFLRKDYQRNQKCYTSFCVSVEVTRLP